MATMMTIGVLLAAVLSAGAAGAGTPTYILNGYSFGKMPGVNTAEIEAKLKHKQGDRITEADVAAEQAVVARELEARHIKGQLFASIAEKNGRVWIIFDLQHPEQATAPAREQVRYLESQSFEGGTRIPDSVLAVASGLHSGQQLSLEQVRAARRAILAAYAKAMPGKEVFLKTKMQTTVEGRVRLTWMITEPQ